MDFNNKDISRFDEFFRENMESFQPELPADVWTGVDRAVSAKAAAGAATGAKVVLTILKVAAVVIPASLGIWWLATDRDAAVSKAPGITQSANNQGNSNAGIQQQEENAEGSTQLNSADEHIVNDNAANELKTPAQANKHKLTAAPGNKILQHEQPKAGNLQPAKQSTDRGGPIAETAKPRQSGTNNVSRKADFEANRRVVCLGETIEFTNLSDGQFDHFKWDFDGEQFPGTKENITYTFNRQGIYTVTLTAYAGIEKSSKVMQIRVQQTQAYFTTEKSSSGNVVTFKNQSVNAGTYTWDFGDHSPLGHEANPQHTYGYDKEKFDVMLIASNGNCTDTFKMEVQPLNVTAAGLFVPNVITPDGDGKNDRWIVKTDKPFVSYHVLIMNRAGQMIYESNDLQEGWDGHTKIGKSCSAGDYFYILEYSVDGQKQEHKTGLIKLIE